MQIKKLSMLLILASTLATGTAIAQETDGATDTDDAQTERQRPDRDQARQRRENMSDEDRAAARERRENMSDEDRQAARDKMRSRRGGEGQRPNGQRGGKQPNGDRPQGGRKPKAESDGV
jgi:hypothetical protein